MYLRKVPLSPKSANHGLFRESWFLIDSVACTAIMIDDLAFFRVAGLWGT